MNRSFAWIVLTVIPILALASCETDNPVRLPSRESDAFDTTGLTLLARLFHVSDTHQVDEESPARLAGGHFVTRSAWRPYEAYATQLFDGVIRTANRIHAAGRTIDFAVHTGDACDNAQFNELAWFLGVFDGSIIDPRSGPDDRPADARPVPELDAHAAFQAQGIYRNGVHGPAADIPWYGVFGNHDVYAIGVFPFFEMPEGRRVVPLPLQIQPGILLPSMLDPTAFLAHGNVTPAMPGPPDLITIPTFLEPNADRAFFNKREFIRAMFGTVTGPSGHGFADPETGPSYYSVTPVPGIRLIGLDTCDPAHLLPAFVYVDGSLTEPQVAFLRSELDAARDRGELVIVASHHPSNSIREIYGTALLASEFRALLNEYPNVIMHLAGHTHRNRVADRGGYLEIETCSTIDLPQEGRLVEIYRNETTGEITVAYEMFGHVVDDLPPLGADPLRALRQAARNIATADRNAAARQKQRDPSGANPLGRPQDRRAVYTLPMR